MSAHPNEEYMKKVAAHYRGTKVSPDGPGSIRNTAIVFGISRNKVRKILVTQGELHSPLTDEIVRLRGEGMDIREVARTLGISIATVSVAMPYGTGREEEVDE